MSIPPRRAFIRSAIAAGSIGAAGFALTPASPSFARASSAVSAPTNDDASSTHEWLASRRVVPRREVAAMSEADVALLCDGIRILCERSAANPLDPRDWYTSAQLHSAFWQHQYHRGPSSLRLFFLPRHLGYLPSPDLKVSLDRCCVTQFELTDLQVALSRTGAPLFGTLVPVQLRDRIMPLQSREMENTTLRIEA